MALFPCPECGRQISDRADTCPNCGLPKRYFFETVKANLEDELELPALRNAVIAFDHSCQSLFGTSHYITTSELRSLEKSFSDWAEKLSDKKAYEYCQANAHLFSVDMTIVNTCLWRYEKLKETAESHNTEYTDRIVKQNAQYFDNLLNDIDPNIKLDEEQRRAVVADDDYCLLVAGAGSGKTTTMAAKVKPRL